MGSTACILRLAVRNGLFLNDSEFPVDSLFLFDGLFLGEVLFLQEGLFLQGIPRGGACEGYILGRLRDPESCSWGL